MKVHNPCKAKWFRCDFQLRPLLTVLQNFESVTGSCASDLLRSVELYRSPCDGPGRCHLKREICTPYSSPEISLDGSNRVLRCILMCPLQTFAPGLVTKNQYVYNPNKPSGPRGDCWHDKTWMQCHLAAEHF